MRRFLITGGTGSFGESMVAELLNDSQVDLVRVLSRDEKKQHDLMAKVNDSRFDVVLGDVRNARSVMDACNGIDSIFHAAALKQVPSCELWPIEATLTNCLGTRNVLDGAREQGVSSLVCLSTDKAVYPINAMGASKALMEKIVLSYARKNSSGLSVSITRYGNVLASRGSLLEVWSSAVDNGKPLKVTDPEMSRFVMVMDDATNLVKHAMREGRSGSIYIKPVKAAWIRDMLLAFKIWKGLDKDYPVEIIGIRPGEKLHEDLFSIEESRVTVATDDFLEVRYDNTFQEFFDGGQAITGDGTDYEAFRNSFSAPKFSVQELIELFSSHCSF